MDKDTLKSLFFYNGKYCAGLWRNAQRATEVWELPGSSLSEKVWNGLYSRPNCFCGKKTAWVNFKMGYRPTCSSKCAQTHPVMEFEKRHRLSSYWANDEWKQQTATKMKEAHFKSRTPKKLAKLAEKGIIPLDDLQPGQSNEYRWKHNCGEIFTKPFARTAAIYCPRCHVSQGQGELYEEIRKLYDGVIIVNDRQAIAPKEIDIYLPDLKLGFEFNGAYWHPGDGAKEAQKSEECTEAGITLVHVWEQEWKKNRKAERQNLLELFARLVVTPIHTHVDLRDRVLNELT